MPISNDFEMLTTGSIIITRDERQRRKIDTSGLRDSIAQIGIINPLVVKRERSPEGNWQVILVAGERRLQSALELNLPLVPIRYYDELDPQETQIIELEENLKRSDLEWREEVAAIAKLHETYTQRDASWTMKDTATALSLQIWTVSRYLRVAKDLDSPRLAQATGVTTAYNLLMKLDQRVADSAIGEILEGSFEAFAEVPGASVKPQSQGVAGGQDPSQSSTHPLPSDLPAPTPAMGTTYAQPRPTIQPLPQTPPSPESSILNLDFLSWAPTYSGPKFNLIHCDFPYGINAFDGSKMATGANSSADMGPNGMALAKARAYEDRPELYWDLLACLCHNLDNIMSHSAHLMFWFSFQHYTQTMEFFRQRAPSLTFARHPLVWIKTDHRGVLSDPKRTARHIYETCLVASREDRFITRSVSDGYWAPSDKSDHPSAKPEPMLRYFMGMLVDSTTRILDPTCGGGSALRAAESLGASASLGLELDPTHCANAQAALRKFRLMAKMG